ncbi:MAG TPA: flavin reductase family protein [Acidimicrobiales bacterium]|nr:flavin reductase family protein [Acidimicrobiales bacterium]
MTQFFHDLMGDLDGPMIIVTCAVGDERSGCLVGFSGQCSIDPPLYVVCISRENHTHRVATRADVLAVHVLDQADAPLAEVFGHLTGDDTDKLALVDWSDVDGVPVLDGTAGWFLGQVVDRFLMGDHTAHVLAPMTGERRRPVVQLGFQDVKDVEPGHQP